MSISAKCPNGHVLKVKDEYAGKSGLCPHCHSRVFVPMPIKAEKASITDDEILGLLGPASPLKPEPPPPDPASALDAVHEAPKRDSAIDLLRSSLLKKQKVCPRCAHPAPLAFTHCSRCGTPLPNPVGEKKK
jgi:DNA-directed RNA polymerase subunit RPC12/RpoP